MEVQFQSSSSRSKSKSKSKSTSTSTSTSTSKSKFVGVRQRGSGKWVAEIKNTSEKIRVWLGTFDTAEEAAQAYDEAACLLRGSNTRTNLLHTMPCNPALSLKIRNLVCHKRSLQLMKKQQQQQQLNNNSINHHPNPMEEFMDPPLPDAIHADHWGFDVDNHAAAFWDLIPNPLPNVLSNLNYFY